MDQRVHPSGVPNVDYTYTPDPGGMSGTLNPTDFPALAKEAVANYYNSFLPGSTVHSSDVFVISFEKALQNWKAYCGTIFEDDRLFVLSYDGDKRKIYVDEYVKKGNQEMIFAPSAVGLAELYD